MDRKSKDRFLSVEIDCYFQTISNFLLLLKGTDFKQSMKSRHFLRRSTQNFPWFSYLTLFFSMTMTKSLLRTTAQHLRRAALIPRLHKISSWRNWKSAPSSKRVAPSKVLTTWRRCWRNFLRCQNQSTTQAQHMSNY